MNISKTTANHLDIKELHLNIPIEELCSVSKVWRRYSFLINITRTVYSKYFHQYSNISCESLRSENLVKSSSKLYRGLIDLFQRRVSYNFMIGNGNTLERMLAGRILWTEHWWVVLLARHSRSAFISITQPDLAGAKIKATQGDACF